MSNRRRSSPKSRGKTASDAGVIRVGLLGLGTVGAGVAEILARHRRLISERVGVELRPVRALVRHRKRRRSGPAAEVPLTSDPAEILEAPDIDIVAELVGGIEPAREWITRALKAGKHVVTANKAVLAAHGNAIFSTAASVGADIYFEAAVAGGVPIIRTLREGLASDRITRICGILNGTTNYVLEAMGSGADYRSVLADAQRQGFAEPDPTLDVSGRDAADKLVILAQLAFGARVRAEDIPTQGITDLGPEVIADARELGYKVKLLALAERRKGGIDLRVHPTFVSLDHPLSAVPGAQNAVAVTSDALGVTSYQGAGAGGLPTGSSVVSDLIEAARNVRAGISGRIAPVGVRAPKILPADDAVSAYYLRLSVADKPGVLASVAQILADHGISLATVLQRERGERPTQPVAIVITTHPTKHGPMREALRAVGKLGAMRSKVKMVRIEGAVG